MSFSVIPLLFAALLLACVAWHAFENLKLSRNLQSDGAEDSWIKRLMRFAWLRSAQVVLALAAGLAVAYYASGQLESAYSEVSEAKLEAQRYAQEAKNGCQPAEADASAPSGQDINAVFGANADTSTPQAVLDGIKQRYEELLISYFFLKKCQLTRQEDYHLINSALLQDMASVNAPSRLQYDILTAARGSYEEMYSRTACTQAGIDQLGTNFRAYLASIAAREPAQ